MAYVLYKGECYKDENYISFLPSLVQGPKLLEREISYCIVDCAYVTAMLQELAFKYSVPPVRHIDWPIWITLNSKEVAYNGRRTSDHGHRTPST